MSMGMNNCKITSLPPPTTSEFHVVFQPFPSLPAIPGFLGSIPGTKEQGLEVDLESEKVHRFSMALHAYWLPRIAYYCRL